MNLPPHLTHLGIKSYFTYLTKQEINIIYQSAKTYQNLNENENEGNSSLNFLKVLLDTLDLKNAKLTPLSMGMQSLIGYLCLITNQYPIINELYDLGYSSLLPWKLIIYYYNFGAINFPFDLYDQITKNEGLFLAEDIIHVKAVLIPLLTEEPSYDINDLGTQDFFWNKMFHVDHPLPSIFLALYSILFRTTLAAELYPENLTSVGNLLFSAIIRAQEVENYYVLGRFLQVLGTYHIQNGNFQDALEAQQESYNLLLDAGDERSAMAVFANLASTYFTNGDITNAKIVEKIAVEYYRRKNIEANFFYTTSYLATILAINGDITEAKEYLKLLQNVNPSLFLVFTLHEMLMFSYTVSFLREEKLLESIINKITMEINLHITEPKKSAHFKLVQMLLIIFHELYSGNIGNAEEVLNQITLIKQNLNLQFHDAFIYKIHALILIKQILIDPSPKKIEELNERINFMINVITHSPRESLLLPPLITIREAIKAITNRSEIPPLLLGNFTQKSPLSILENGNEFISHFNEVSYFGETDHSIITTIKFKLLESYFIQEVFLKSFIVNKKTFEVENSLLSIIVLGTGGVTLYQHIVNGKIEAESVHGKEKSQSIPHDLLANFYNVISLKYSQILQQDQNRFQKIFRFQNYSVIFRPCNEKNYFVVGIMKNVNIKELNTMKFVATKIDNDPELPRDLFYSTKKISERLRKIIEECLTLTL